MTGKPTVIILGGGAAGVGAALGLAERGFSATLVEERGQVGGNAGSFELGGMRVDYGSHRLHPAADPEVMKMVRSVLGPDLRERPRHGRIRLGERWVHFPIRPLDLAFHAPPGFLLGVLSDAVRGAVKAAPPTARREEEETFETALLRGLGPTLCKRFYFPFTRKIWGLEPGEISLVQATRRVSARSTGRLLRRLLPGGGNPGGRAGHGHPTFYYPRNGFGQICEALWEAARERGAMGLMAHTVRRVAVAQGSLSVTVEPTGAGGAGAEADHRSLVAPHVWSTLPIGTLPHLVMPPPPAEVLRAADDLAMRAMVLVYLVLGRDRFTEFDAHYFPSLDLPFTRISEPKNYSGRQDPDGRTVLCVEIPCSAGDPTWSADESALVQEVLDGLARVGLAIRSPIVDTAVRRLPSAYPVYRKGFEASLSRLEDWAEAVPGLLTFGRQGLFAHDNTHHALYMAQSAVRCMSAEGHFEEERWARFRREFATHVVED